MLEGCYAAFEQAQSRDDLYVNEQGGFSTLAYPFAHKAWSIIAYPITSNATLKGDANKEKAALTRFLGEVKQKIENGYRFYISKQCHLSHDHKRSGALPLVPLLQRVQALFPESKEIQPLIKAAQIVPFVLKQDLSSSDPIKDDDIKYIQDAYIEIVKAVTVTSPNSRLLKVQERAKAVLGKFLLLQPGKEFEDEINLSDYSLECMIKPTFKLHEKVYQAVRTYMQGLNEGS